MSTRKQTAEIFEHVPEFRTVDVARSSKAPAVEIKRSEDVIETNLRPSLAFEQFAGRVHQPSKTINQTDVNYDAFQSLNARQTEFISLPNSLGERRALFESPFQRLHRLRSEITEFGAELSQLSQSNTSNPLNDACAAVAAQLSALDHELSALSLDARLQPMAALTSDDASEAANHSNVNGADKLLQHIAAWRASETPASDSKPASNGPSESKQATYEVYLDQAAPSSASTAQQGQSRFVDWERRLASLETLVGPASLMPPTAALERFSGSRNSSTSLSALMPILVQRLELLDKAKIDAVQRRVKALLIDFESLLAARARAETGAADVKAANGHEQRVRDLHAALLRWDSAAQQLPVVIARLQSLAALHEESASAVTRLATIEKKINDAEQLLATDTQLIAQLESTMLENSKVLASNTASLEKRMDALSEAMAKIRR